MNITSQYPSWIYLILLLLALVAAILLYRKDKKLEEFKTTTIWFLAFLRFISLFTLLLLLSAPLVKYFSKQIQEPIFLVAVDNSSSMLMSKDSSYLSNQLKAELEQLKNKLNDDFQIEQVIFDDGISVGNELDFEGKITSYSKVFDDLKASYSNRNVAAMLFVSDGIYNQGMNPLYKQQLDFPIYALAMGDTNVRKDASVDRIINNELAFLGNSFPVEIDINLNKLKEERGVLKIFKGEKLLYTKELVASEDIDIQTISALLEAEEIGLARYRVELSTFKGESFLENNSRDFFVDILDGRQRILILANSPHPDIGALKSALNSKKNYEVNSSLLSDFKEDIKSYNLVVFHHLPHVDKSNEFLKLFEQLQEEKISSFFICGPSQNWTELNQLDLGIQFSQSKSGVNQVFPIPNESFPLFDLEKEYLNRIERFPPASSPLIKVDFQKQSNTLFQQKIGAVETQMPLLTFLENEGHKIGFLFASNIWKWKLSDFNENKDQKAFQSIFLKASQYLALKTDKSYFRLNHADSFLENERISFDAQFYNESYELNNDAEVLINLSDEDGKQYSYTFSKNLDAYYLTIPTLATGNYSYQAEISFAGKRYTEKGQFSIRKIQFEQNDIRANHNLLFQMAEQSGGQLIYKENLQELKSILEARDDLSSIAYQKEEMEEIINLSWILYLLLATLGLEWFIRKRAGAY